MESAPGNRIGAGEKQKGHFGIVPDHGKKNKQQQNQNTGLFLAPGQIFETIKTNGAGHQSAEADSEKQKGHFGIVPDHGKKNKQQQNQNTGLFIFLAVVWNY